MKTSRILLTLALAGMLTGIIGSTSAQDPEKKTIKLGISYRAVNKMAPALLVTAKTKNGKKFEAVEYVEIIAFLGEPSDVNKLGSVVTDRKGTGYIAVPDGLLPVLDSLEMMSFTATSRASAGYEAGEASLEMSKARIELSLSEADSVRTIDATVMAFQEGAWKPLPEAEVKLFVKRLFSDLPVGDETYTTDADGKVTAEYTITLPGDPEGSIIVGAKLDDNDTYGTVIAAQSVKWGTPQAADNSFNKRTLWATRDKTPVWLLIFPNVIIATVWGFIFYLFYLIRKIRKIGTAA
jgi:hypothetical protein